MRLACGAWENPFTLSTSKVNVITFEDRRLFARFTLSISNQFSDGCSESGSFLTSEKEIKPKDAMVFIGDPIAFDLNDRSFIAPALKQISKSFNSNPETLSEAEQTSYRLIDLLSEELNQMNGDYGLFEDWDTEKFLKLMGFKVNPETCETVVEKLFQLVDVSADLFPEKTIVLLNAKRYLSEMEYHSFCKHIVSREMSFLLCEQERDPHYTDLENGLYIDANYLES